MSNTNFIGVGKYRLIKDQGIEFESFHDIDDALKNWFNPIFANIHMGGIYTIKLKDNSTKEEYPYILEYTPLFDRPLFEISGGDITMNFEQMYGRDPTIQEYLLMVQKIGGIFNDYDRDYSEQNEEISRAIYKMIEEKELPVPPTDEELEAMENEES